MILSGFLMAHNYRLRRESEPWARPSTWGVFWVRRWFRIAPLYYLLLVVALSVGPWIAPHRQAIADLWPRTATPPHRYTDHSLANLLAHASFVFGVLPDYAFRTPLPDWSIGLEMQFYLAFPLVMLLLESRPLRLGLGITLLCFWLGVHYADFFRAFEMPSFLPMKLSVFLIGIWAALSRGLRSPGGMRLPLGASLFVCAVAITREHAGDSAGRFVLVLAFFYLVDDGTLPMFADGRSFLAGARRWLAAPLSRFAGETSYALYLVHLLVLIPFAGFLARQPSYLGLPQLGRFLLCAVAAGLASYSAAWLLFLTIEKSGINAGKRLLEWSRDKQRTTPRD